VLIKASVAADYTAYSRMKRFFAPTSRFFTQRLTVTDAATGAIFSPKPLRRLAYRMF
jgi:hypothetical protein